VVRRASSQADAEQRSDELASVTSLGVGAVARN